MNLLSVSLGFLAIASWLSTILLVNAAMQRPRIGALTERAVIAVVLSALGTVAVVLRINGDTGYALFPIDAARIIFGITVLGLLLTPCLWLLLYLSNRLGGEE